MKQLGRVVVVTGAAGGIGRALVDIFATGGDTVVAVDIPDSGVLEMSRQLGHPHLGLECDVSRKQTSSLFTAILKSGSRTLESLSTMRLWGLILLRQLTLVPKIFNSRWR
ncbi:SDR family NAD(P)-dependent oxidoreductase [Rhizobium mongolense]